MSQDVDVTEWGQPVSVVRQDEDGRWRIHPPRCSVAPPLLDVCAPYDTWEQAAHAGMVLYGDVVVFNG